MSLTIRLFRHVIEALITQVLDLNKQLEDHTAGTLIDGTEPLDIEDSNDGECVSEHHRLSTSSCSNLFL